jgi:acyl carrier protein
MNNDGDEVSHMSENASTTTLEQLAREVAKITDNESISVDVSLTELGVDSLNIIEMMVFCEQLYGAFDPERLEISAFTTLADLDQQLQAMTRAVEA